MARYLRLAMFGLVLITSARAESPRGWQGVWGESPTTRPSQVRGVALRDDSVVRTSQDPLTPAPPRPSTPAVPEPANIPPPPVPMEPFGNEPPPPRPGSDSASNVTLRYENMEIRQALELFSRSQRMNLLISPGVAGSITINVEGVTREQALDAILALGSLVSRKVGGLTYIYTADEYKQISNRERKPITRVYRLNYVRAGDTSKMVLQFLSPDGKISATVDSDEGIDENANFSAGLPTASGGGGSGGGGGGGGGGNSTGGNQAAGEDVLIVQDYEENLAIVDDVIAKLDIMPVQVLIEAVIIRVALSKGQSLGSNFGVVDKMHTLLGVVGNGTQLGTTVGFSPLKVLTTAGTLQAGTQFVNGDPNYGIKFGFIGGNIASFVQALETLGKTNVLATPRVLVLNKQRAEIQLGDRLGYRTLVTNLTSTVQQIQFLNTGTLLRLRPFISDNGMIRMEIHPERSTGLIDANGVPQTNTARMTTNVMIPNGATLVIGGLIENQDDTTQSGFPALGRLPGVGVLFRNRALDLVKNEVVILLTPRIWNPGDPEGMNCTPTPKAALDTATRVSQKIELGSDRPPQDGLLGGRLYRDTPRRADRLQANDPGKNPYMHTVRSGENFWTISKTYYKSGRYYVALWAANKEKVAAPEALRVGDKIIIPRADQLDMQLVPPSPTPAFALPPLPANGVQPIAPPPPPAQGTPGPFTQKTLDPAARVTSGAPSGPIPKRK